MRAELLIAFIATALATACAPTDREPPAAAAPVSPAEAAPSKPVEVSPTAPPEAHPLAPESLPNKPETIPEQMPGTTPPR